MVKAGRNRETLVLRPNDDYGDLHSYIAYEHDEGSWARALREAKRSPYVVQESVKPARTVFPLMNFGHLEFNKSAGRRGVIKADGLMIRSVR